MNSVLNGSEQIFLMLVVEEQIQRRVSLSDDHTFVSKAHYIIFLSLQFSPLPPHLVHHFDCYRRNRLHWNASIRRARECASDWQHRLQRININIGVSLSPTLSLGSPSSSSVDTSQVQTPHSGSCLHYPFFFDFRTTATGRTTFELQTSESRTRRRTRRWSGSLSR